MLPSLTSLIRATDTPVTKEIIKEGSKALIGQESKTKDPKPMEIDQEKEKVEKENVFLFAEKDADVSNSENFYFKNKLSKPKKI